MLSRPRAFIVSLSTVGLVLSPTVSAHAVATNPSSPSSLVTLAQARSALPDASEMPGNPQTDVTSSSPAAGVIQPCISPTAKRLTLKQSHSVLRLYVGGGGQPTDLSALPTTFSITAVVFHSTAAAKVGVAEVLRAEKHCAKASGDAEATVTRTLSQSYSARGWTGWRSIDHLALAADPTDNTPGINMRLNAEYLARGNVLLVVNEVGNDTAGTGATQDKARKQATTALLKGFAKL